MANRNSIARIDARASSAVAMIALLMLAGCRDDHQFVSHSPVAVRANPAPHPFANKVHRPVPVSSSVPIDSPADGHPAATALHRARLTATIGEEDGAPPFLFGKIEAVAFGPDNQVFVLDSQNREIRVFDKAGRHITSFSRPGEGPGELTQPIALTVTETAIYIVDLATVHVFVPRGDEFVYSRHIDAGSDVYGLCVRNQQSFLHTISPTDTLLVSRSDSSGIAHRFGMLYHGLPPGSTFQLNASRIACSPANETLVVAPRGILGELRGFDLDGAPKWIVELSGYLPIGYERTATGGSRVTIPEAGWDRLASLSHATGNLFVAQLGYMSYADRLANRAEFTTVFSVGVTDAGEAFSLGMDLPLILAFGEGAFAAVEMSPVPRVRIYKWDRPEGTGAR
jgi:hypothetical protein